MVGGSHEEPKRESPCPGLDSQGHQLLSSDELECAADKETDGAFSAAFIQRLLVLLRRRRSADGFVAHESRGEYHRRIRPGEAG